MERASTFQLAVEDLRRRYEEALEDCQLVPALSQAARVQADATAIDAIRAHMLHQREHEAMREAAHERIGGGVLQYIHQKHLQQEADDDTRELHTE